MEVLKLQTHSVNVSEVSKTDNIQLHFVLCDVNSNRNNVALNRNTIETWKNTIENQPLVNKIRANGKAFRDHEMHIVSKKDLATSKAKEDIIFDTLAFDVFYNTEILPINGVACLVADAEIWGRYPRAIDIIKKCIALAEGFHISWEICVFESHIENDVKVLDRGAFTAHYLIGADRTHPPWRLWGFRNGFRLRIC